MSHVICDKERCTGCLACVVACLEEHHEVLGDAPLSPRIHEKRTSPRTGMVCYTTRSCLHCADAPCLSACPAGALVRDELGFVRPVRENCVGCRQCARACPHGVPRFDGEGKLVKCDGCADRVARGLEPACVRVCAPGALRLSD